MSLKTTPLVSIITNSYNSSFFIKDCVESILNQTYINWELIIIDCGSVDNTLEILSNYTDNRIKVFSINFCGVAEGRNFGIEKANGKYIAILDSDDISMSNRLMHQVSFLESNTNFIAAGSGISTFSSNKSTSKLFSYDITNEDIFYLLLSGFNPIPHSTLIFKKSVIDKIGMYNKVIEKAEDYDFILRLTNFGEIKLHKEILVKYRISETSHTKMHIPNGKDTFYFVILSQLFFYNEKNNIKISKDKIINWLNLIEPKKIRKLLYIWSFYILTNQYSKLRLITIYLLFKQLYFLHFASIYFSNFNWWKKNKNPNKVLMNYFN